MESSPASSPACCVVVQAGAGRRREGELVSVGERGERAEERVLSN